MKSSRDGHVLQEVIHAPVAEHGQPNFLDHMKVSVAVAKSVLVVLKLFLAHELSQLGQLLGNRQASQVHRDCVARPAPVAIEKELPAFAVIPGCAIQHRSVQ